MKDRPAYQEPLSTILRGSPLENERQIANVLRWLARSAVFIFLALLIAALSENQYREALAISIGIIPILISNLLIRRGMVSVPSAILTIVMILLLTWLATVGYGIHDFSIIGYPVIMVFAGLILRGSVTPYLTGLIVLCLGWLVYGNILGLYDPLIARGADADDFFIVTAVILVASNAVHLLTENMHQSLARAREEIESRGQAEKEREEVIRQLRSKNQELNRFAVHVSHDLKTPLITMAGYLGYLEKDALTGNAERIGRDIAQINDAAKKMGRLVDELLDLSRVGRIVNPPTDAPFEEIAREALSAAEGLLKARQVQVRMDAGFPVVHVDRVRIVQVIQNLVTNSVKFMGGQENPLIEIRLKEMDGAQIFLVRDNGIGIDPQHHEQIFGLFNKLDPKTEGAGLGLGLVKRIIEVHGGKIWVESEPGKGATFYFTLAEQTPREIS